MVKSLYLQSNLNRLQAVIYVKSLDLSKPLLLANSLKENGRLPFDGQESVLPIPPDAPLEIPRIMLNSSDGVFSCNVSANRIDLFFNEQSKTKISTDDVLKRINKYLIRINDIVHKDYSAKAHRIALIANTIIELNISSRKFIEQKYLQKNIAKDIYEIQLNMLSKKEIGKFKVNQWVRMQTLRKKNDPDNDKAIQIVFDINTFPEINYDLLSDSIFPHSKKSAYHNHLFISNDKSNDKLLF